MGERAIENRVKKLQEIEAMQKELEAQAEVIKAEIKAEMEEKGVQELKTKNFVIRWKEVASSRLDDKALKAALPEIYKQFVKQAVSRTGTISRKSTS